jgi:hypothetical protein
MKIPPHVPIDDNTVIVINGVSTITWSGFLEINVFDSQEVEEMSDALQETGEYHGGGGRRAGRRPSRGAAARFHLSLLTHKVTEFKLSELREIFVDESVLFEGIDPESLVDEAKRIGNELNRTFTIGGVKCGTRIWRTA